MDCYWEGGSTESLSYFGAPVIFLRTKDRVGGDPDSESAPLGSAAPENLSILLDAHPRQNAEMGPKVVSAVLLPPRVIDRSPKTQPKGS